MGRKLVISGTKLTDLNAPRLVTVDPIESSGSLLLIDMAHPSAQWANGVPVEGSVVPNLLASTASDIAGTASNLHNVTMKVGAGWDGVAGKLERTSKGGLHAIISQTAVPGTVSLRTQTSALVSYILANVNHSYYFSTWVRKTRLNKPVTSGVPLELTSLASYSGPAGSYHFRKSAGDAPLGTPVVLKSNPIKWTGTAPATESGSSHNWLLAGRTGGMNNFNGNELSLPSHIMYRVYFEDLTVSGRTYNEVSALDDELFNKEVLTSGGRYYGDTFTDPATIA